MITIDDLDEVMYDGLAYRHLTHDGRETPHGEPLALCGAFGIVNWQGGSRCPSCVIHSEALTGEPWPTRLGCTP